MKKMVLGFISILLIVGCSSKEVKEKTDVIKKELDFSKIQANLAGISVTKNVETDIFFENNVEVIADYLVSEYNISLDNMEEYIFNLPSDDSSNMYAIIKPKKNKHDDVKAMMELFFNNYRKKVSNKDLVDNRLVKEYDDYLVYIVSPDNDIVFKKIISE